MTNNPVEAKAHCREVNAIAPGIFPSEMARITIEDTEMVNKIGKAIVLIPIGRVGK